MTTRPFSQGSRLLLAALCLAGVTVAPAAQQPPPQFRTGVDLTRVEITVLHKDTRKPITGLKAEDFVIKVDGDVQQVATLAEVTVPTAGEVAAPGLVEAAHDVAGNDQSRPRLFVILMNDAAGGNDPFDRHAGASIAHSLIDQLGPEDKAAVVFTRDNRHAQDLTSDRTLLRRAVERFTPMHTLSAFPLHVQLKVLERAQAFLAETTGYRRALIYISPTPLRVPDKWDYEGFGVNEEAEAGASVMRAIATTSRIGHVPLYLFSTHGLSAPTAEELRSRQGQDYNYENYVEIIRNIGRLTGGRAFIASNTPDKAVPAVFQELVSYYAVAYQNTHPLDGRNRWLEITVKRPEALVMPARVLITPTSGAARSEGEGSAMLNPARESGLPEALAAPLPSGAVPLRLSSVPLAMANAKEQAVALTLGLPRVPPGVNEEFRVRLQLFDGEGRREVLGNTRDVRLPGAALAAGEWNEVALRLDLRPGRYQLRIAAERRSTQTAGSVHATIIVPDFERETLSLSGVAIGRAAGRPIGGREVLADLLPFAPTVVRDLTRGERVGALLWVHQARQRPAQAVVVETEILDATGALVHTATRTLTADGFAGGAAVEHRYELPLATLSAGDYLLRFVATVAEVRVQRDVRFSVR